jgi:hypothetical protein
MNGLKETTVLNQSTWQEHWSSCAKSVFRSLESIGV